MATECQWPSGHWGCLTKQTRKIQPASPTMCAKWDEGDRRESTRGVRQEQGPGRVAWASQATEGWGLMEWD